MAMAFANVVCFCVVFSLNNPANSQSICLHLTSWLHARLSLSVCWKRVIHKNPMLPMTIAVTDCCDNPWIDILIENECENVMTCLYADRDVSMFVVVAVDDVDGDSAAAVVDYEHARSMVMVW